MVIRTACQSLLTLRRKLSDLARHFERTAGAHVLWIGHFHIPGSGVIWMDSVLLYFVCTILASAHVVEKLWGMDVSGQELIPQFARGAFFLDFCVRY